MTEFYNKEVDNNVEVFSKFHLGQLVLFLFHGNLIHGIIIDAEFSYENKDYFLYTIEFENTEDNKTYYINISESQLVDPAEFLAPDDDQDDYPEFEPEDLEQKTSGNCYYTIFPEYDEPAVHIEIQPNWLWSAEDIWELIDDLSEWATIIEQVPEDDFPGEVEETTGIGTNKNLTANLNLDASQFVREIENDSGNITVNLNLDASDFYEELEKARNYATDVYHNLSDSIESINNKINEQEGLLKIEAKDGEIKASVKSAVGDSSFNLDTGNFITSVDKTSLLKSNEQKPLFAISFPGSVSEEVSNLFTSKIRGILKEANIDAIPLMMSDGMIGKFIYP